MHPLILQLRTEHGAIIRSLYRLSALAATLAANPESKPGSLWAVMTSLTDWPDRLHHPKEELIFDRICERSGQAPPLIRRLRSEHRTLVSQGRELSSTLDDWTQGAAVDLPAVRRQVHGYIRAQRWHIIQEEHGLYRLAESVLADSDWTDLEQQVRQHVSPNGCSQP